VVLLQPRRAVLTAKVRSSPVRCMWRSYHVEVIHAIWNLLREEGSFVAKLAR